MAKINLEKFAGGALQEKFDMAAETVLANMKDLNTPWKNKRSITVKVTFQQNEDRDDAQVDVSVDWKTAPVAPISTRMSIGKDLKTGEVFAQEYGKQVRGQMTIEDYQTPQEDLQVDGKTVDPETGEIKEEPDGKVVDMRAAKQA
ncbi:hypothetical protein [Lacrimispora sp.]|uniref:hypothetical protein n=1 Tax=Lacrimispora sp. TaxID=2719234 RepID=UPI0039944209